MRRYLRFRCMRFRQRKSTWFPPLLLTAVLSIIFFVYLSKQLAPMIKTAAISKATNLITASIGTAAERAMSEEQYSYQNFIEAQTDGAGNILSLSFNTAEGIRFRHLVIDQLIEELEGISPDELSIPLGTVTGILLLSSVGPPLRVRVQSVGDVTAQFDNEFTAVGINQSRHSIYLTITATVYLLIPGETVAVSTEERICIAETIIVGNVPDTYLNLQGVKDDHG